jgi:hypothetical protein
MAHPEFIAYGALGAASLELFKLYEYRGKLHLKKFQKLVRSPLFWLVVFGMLCAAGFIAWAMNMNRDGVSVWEVVVTGIAARSIVRELLAAKEAQSPIKLGEDSTDKVTVKDIFV